LLAVDRNNPRVADLYDSFHPAVLGALKHVADEAKQNNCTISVCGEMAGSPAGALLLMAMGYDMLSMNATNLPRVKSVIRSIDSIFAAALLDEVMVMDNAQIITSTVELALNKLGQGRMLGPVAR
jgi:phosphotransferase system enzyme I (PtsP)